MKTIREEPLLLTIVLILFLAGKDRLPVLSLFLCGAYWFYRTKDRSFLLVTLFLLTFLIPRTCETKPDCDHGIVTHVSAKYAEVRSGLYRYIVYSDTILPLDAEIAFSGTYEKITSSPHFYAFSFADYCQRKGIFYSCDAEEITVIKEHSTIRRKLQKKIEETENEAARTLFYRLLLNIRESSDYPESYLYDHGFSWSGILAFLSQILKYLLDEKKQDAVLLVCTILLCAAYMCPMMLVQILIFRVLSLTKLSAAKRSGWGMILTLFLFPGSVFTASFLIPAVYRFTAREKHRRLSALTGISVIQSLLYQSVNPLMSFCYPAVRIVTGFAWFIALLSLFTLPGLILDFCALTDRLLLLLDSFAIPGSILGCGLLFFVLLVIFFPKKEYRLHYALILFHLFLLTGMFHPFAEVTFLNVGQGDSILIRLPFNTETVLVDTGKPSQQNTVDTFLKAKSIRRLDTLIITHSDNDHSGNQEYITMHYQPARVITEHQAVIESGRLTLYDLNTIRDEDENRSSITSLFQLNGLTYLLTGDCDSLAEEKIADAYNRLHVDVLKLSHHGSATGSSDLFLDTLRPDLAVISSGAYRIYHHPSPDTIQRLLKRHIPYLDTKTEGDITILCLPFVNLLITAKGTVSLL